MKRLDEIFDIWYGVNLELVNCEQSENGIPFVSRQSVNNGIAGFVKPIDIEPNPAHSLSIAGSGSVLSTFYHDYEYYSGRDVYIAKPKQNLTKEQMLYYAYLIEDNKYRYNYGRQANKTMKNILVPDVNELPDYVNKMSVSDYQFEEEPIIQRKIKLNTEAWKWFRYDEIFDIRKGKRLTKADMIEGNTNYIGATDSNNGITAKIANDEQIHDSNKITVSYNGSIAEAFYQDKPFWATDDVNVLYPKFELNPYIAMFLCTLIYKEKYRFNYGRKWDKEMMQGSKIKLPVTKNNSPDWQFMEDYIKSLPYSNNI
jgi:hypothetical protein